MAAYLITQAMGQQSQWVIKNLLEADVTIHAIVRNLDRIPARLDSRNIELFHAESKNFDDVFKAAQGCKAVFLNTFSFPGLEAVRAKTAIEACEKVGVMSIVAFTSILTRKKKHFWRTGFIKSTVPELHQYQLSKYEVEGIARGSGLQSYIIF